MTLVFAAALNFLVWRRGECVILPEVEIMGPIPYSAGHFFLGMVNLKGTVMKSWSFLALLLGLGAWLTVSHAQEAASEKGNAAAKRSAVADEVADESEPAGEPSGESEATAEGEATEGEATEGEATEGEATEGETTEGDDTGDEPTGSDPEEGDSEKTTPDEPGEVAGGDGKSIDPEAEADVDLSSDLARASYIMGIGFARKLVAEGVEIDRDILLKGLRDGLRDYSQMTDDEMMAAMKSITVSNMERRQKRQRDFAKANKAAGDKFRKENMAKQGVQVTKSGLQYKIIKAGKGPKPKADDTVRLHYEGTFVNGQVFDSTLESKVPAEVRVNGVMPGWTEALMLMSRGAKWQVVIPPELALGKTGNDRIPANSTLIFEFELLGIEKAGTLNPDGLDLKKKN